MPSALNTVTWAFGRRGQATVASRSRRAGAARRPGGAEPEAATASCRRRPRGGGQLRRRPDPARDVPAGAGAPGRARLRDRRRARRLARHGLRRGERRRRVRRARARSTGAGSSRFPRTRASPRARRSRWRSSRPGSRSPSSCASRSARACWSRPPRARSGRRPCRSSRRSTAHRSRPSGSAGEARPPALARRGRGGHVRGDRRARSGRRRLRPRGRRGVRRLAEPRSSRWARRSRSATRAGCGRRSIPAWLVGRNIGVHGFYLGRLMGRDPELVGAGRRRTSSGSGRVAPYGPSSAPSSRSRTPRRRIASSSPGNRQERSFSFHDCARNRIGRRHRELDREEARAEGFEVQELDLVHGFDVSDPEAWEHIGSVDLACLNAGVITGDEGQLTELTDEQYRRALGVNVDGVVFGVRRLDRVMPKGSTIVVTASLAGLTAIPDDPIYGLTKHAVVGFVRSVAPQLAERGIRIQAVCPGWADTSLTTNGVPRRAQGAGLPPALARRGRGRRVGGVQERGHGRGVDRPARPRAAPLRVQGRPRPALAGSVAAASPCR